MMADVDREQTQDPSPEPLIELAHVGDDNGPIDFPGEGSNDQVNSENEEGEIEDPGEAINPDWEVGWEDWCQGNAMANNC